MKRVLWVGLVLSFCFTAEAASRYGLSHDASPQSDGRVSADPTVAAAHRAYRLILDGRIDKRRVGRIAWEGDRHQKGDLFRDKDGPKRAKYGPRTDSVKGAAHHAVATKRLKGQTSHDRLAP